MNPLVILLVTMTVTTLPNLSSFTDISLPLSDGIQKHDTTGPLMDYDNTEEEDYDDYDDYSDSIDTRKSGRLRQQIKDCEFIDLTALGPLCNSGKKIKYYKVSNSNKYF